MSSLHNKLVEKAKENFKNEGYLIHRLPGTYFSEVYKSHYPDVTGLKKHEFLIVEVKASFRGRNWSQSLFRGAGQLLFYKHAEETKEAKSRFKLGIIKYRLILVIPVSFRNKLTELEDNFFKAHGIEVIQIEV